MQKRPKKVINSKLAATSVVRLIEVMRPPDPALPPHVIVKPKPTRRQIPGTKLLKKLAHDRAKVKRRSKSPKAINMEAVDEAIEGIMRDLETSSQRHSLIER